MRITLFAAVALLAPGALLAQSSESVDAAVNSITPEDVAHRIGVIAHDSMRGRTTPSPELDEVAQYIADEFRRFGLAPGGHDGGFIQRYPLRWMQVDSAASLVAVEDGPTWRLGTDVARFDGSTTAEGMTSSVVVLAGTEGGPDAVQQQPLEGAIVIWVVPASGIGREFYRMLSTAASMDPAALILVTNQSGPRWRARLRRGFGTELRLGWSQESGPPMLMVKDETIAPTLGHHGFDLAAARTESGTALDATALETMRLTVKLPERVVEELWAPNTVGILEGSDPAIKDEYIVFSAHMDHVGQSGQQGAACSPVEGDDICNGADDDASGTIAVVELAEAFARLEPRPKRSMIFVTVSGEEKGMWGSDYFTSHPPVPIEQMVANLNADMVGRNWTDTIAAIGLHHSDLGTTLFRVAGEHPELNMTPVDDQWPEENFYRRSDHYNFAEKGVPILFFFNGTHPDYHRPSDGPEKIDAEKESRIAKLMFYLGLEIANAPERPRWDPESYAEIVRPGGTE
jgi:hypothetical protein